MNNQNKCPRRLSAWVFRGLASLMLTMSAVAQLSLTQPDGITINNNAAATPYPSKLTVANITTPLTKITVTLRNVTHNYPADVGILLVPPGTNAPIALMAGASIQGNLSTTTFTLDDAASSPIPAADPITDGGTYQPVAYTFPTGANLSTLISQFGGPAGPYATTLSSVNGSGGTNVNGDWKLYVIDAEVGSFGAIGSWSLQLWTQPTISSSTNLLVIPENGSTSFTVNLGSSTASVTNLLVTAGSYDPSIIPNSYGPPETPHGNIAITGSGLTRTITVAPTLNAFGTNSPGIEVQVKDLGAASAPNSSSFVRVPFRVFYVPQPPTISLNTNVVTTLAGTITTNVLFATVNDPQTGMNNIQVAAISSTDPNIVSTNGVFFSGTGGVRPFAIVPTGLATGKATVTIGAFNTNQLMATTTITVTVNPLNPPNFYQFARAGTISLPPSTNSTPTPSTPNPSTISVAGVSGLVANLGVILNGVTNLPNDGVDLVLTAPSGASVYLLANGGSAPGSPANYGQITFTSGPNSTPTNSALQNVFVSLGNLGLLSGQNANGNWSLYATNSSGFSSAILGGWILNLYPAPTLGSPGDQTTPENTDVRVTLPIATEFGVITNRAGFTVANSNPNLVGFLNPVLTSSSYSFTVRPKTNANSLPSSDFGPPNLGPATITVSYTNNYGFSATNSFKVTVTPVNQPPTISAIPKFVTPVGVPNTKNFTVGSVDWDAAKLVVTATSSNPKALPNDNIVLGGSGANRTVTIYPADSQAGEASITFVVRDPSGTSTDRTVISVPVIITDPNNPVYGNGQQPIFIVPNSAANPYPSQIAVSGLVSTIADVSVTLFNVTHPNAQSINVLLVGPTNQTVLLLSHAGGATGVTNATLIFSDSATSIPTQTDPLVSGTYRPMGYNPVVTFTNAPPGPYGTSLNNTFIGGNPNGTWKLYILDDNGGPAKTGLANGGWQLSIRTSPKVSPISDVTVNETTPPIQSKVAVAIGDVQNGANTVVTALSTEGTVVPNDATHLQVTGAGATRTLLITPALYAFGTNTITVTATDGVTTSQQSFRFIVNFVNQAPVISPVANQNGLAGTPLPPIPFWVFDPDSPISNISVTANSADQTVVRDSDISIVYLGSTNYTISVPPVGVATGSTAITITAVDNSQNKATRQFNVTFAPQLAYANNDGPIVIPQLGAATPYPSVTTVSKVEGVLSKATVTLVGLAHPSPQDLVILLVPPTGSKSVVLMGHAGGFTNNTTRITFDDASTVPLPFGPTAVLKDGTYHASDYTASIPSLNYPGFLPAPAPNSGYSTNLSDLNGINPNGTWSLYVLDDAFPDGGTLDHWILTLQTSPTLDPIGPQTTRENVALTVPVTLHDSTTDPTNLVVTASIQGTQYPANLVAPTNLVVSTNLTLNRTLTITPTLNLPSAITYSQPSTNSDGTNLIVLSVTGGKTPYSQSFPLKVLYVNQAPVVTTATNAVTTLQNVSTNLVFNMGDVDSFLAVTNITVTSSNPSLVPNTTTNLVVSGSGTPAGTSGNISVNVVPLLNQFGTTVITFAVSDGSLITTSSVTLTVTHVVQPPVISTVPNQQVIAGNATTNILFQVGDPETPPQALAVGAVSDNPTLVPNSPANIIIGRGADATLRTVQLIPVGTTAGTANITLVVTNNGGKTASTTFTLKVDPSPDFFFANSTPITIRDTNSALPYPSTIAVSGLVGNVYHVSVTLLGLGHASPDDVDVILVNPAGKAVVLMSDSGGFTPITNVNLTFTDGAPPLPPSSQITSGTNSPTDYNFANDFFPAHPNLPVAPYQTSLAALAGGNPNGTWYLYVNDHRAGGSGTIASGWSLRLTTSPTLTITTPTPPNALKFLGGNSGVINFSVSDNATSPTNLNYSFTTDNSRILPASSNVVIAAVSGSPGQYTATVYNAFLQYSGSTSNNLTLIATRSDGASASGTVPFYVFPTNYPPIFSRLRTVFMDSDTSTNVQVLITDVDTPFSLLKLGATSDTPGLIPNGNLSINGGTNSVVGIPANGLVTLGITPKAAQFGTAIITLTLTDTNAAAPAITNTILTSFQVVVSKVNHAPTFSSIVDQAVTAGGSTTNIAFTVRDVDTPPQNLTVTSSFDSTYIQSVVVTPVSGLSGVADNRTVRVTAQPGVQGITQVTLNVNDGLLTNKTSFNVTVNPSRQQIFSNRSPITIVDFAPANPYPAQVQVNGFNGQLKRIAVTLNGFAHGYAPDVSALLVHPDGKQKVLLMRHNGPGGSVTNLNLTFDASASGPISTSSPWASGTYLPSSTDNSGLYSFPTNSNGQPPGRPYSVDLSTFTNSPNGAWSLYITDDQRGDAGVVTAGFSLTISSKPLIGGLGQDLALGQNTTLSVPFTVMDDQINANQSFTFTTSSDTPSLITSAGVTVTGSNTNYTLNINPVPFVTGTAMVTVTAKNPDGDSDTKRFKVVVTPVPQPPTITQVTNQTVVAGGSVTVTPFNYGDPVTPIANLAFTIQSSNTTVLPTNNIVLLGNSLRITPNGTNTGVSQVTLTVVNQAGLSTNTVFTVTVLPNPLPLFVNTAGIVINDNTAATPYPSTLNVTNLNGNIRKVTVTFNGLSHAFPSDISMLLVSPTGAKVVLMSRSSTVAANNVRFTLDDAATNPLPATVPTALVDGTYKPGTYRVGGDSFFTPAPIGPYSTTLSAFNGVSPNGTWSLYVEDTVPLYGGNIVNGWQLNILTDSPLLAPIADQTMAENTTLRLPVTVITGGATTNLVVTASASNSNPADLIPPQGLVVTGTGTNRLLSITPTVGEIGTSVITLAVTDGFTTNTTSFNLAVTFQALPPVILGLSDFSTPANLNYTQPFTVSSSQGLGNISVTSSVANPRLGTIATTGAGGNWTLNFTPNGTTGSSVATVIVSDGLLSSTNTYNVTVTAPLVPSIPSIADVTTPAQPAGGTPVVVPFSVINTLSTNVVVTASSANTNLVASVTTASLGGSNYTATVTLVPYVNSTQFGPAVVALTATDINGTATNSFNLIVSATEFPPVLAPIADVHTFISTAVVVPLTVTSPATAVSNLSFFVNYSNGTLVQSAVVNVNNNQASLSIVPFAGKTGFSAMTVSVSDGRAVSSQSFVFSVGAPRPPSLGPIADQTTPKNTTLPVLLNLTSPDTAIQNLQYSGTSSDTNLVSNIGFFTTLTNAIAIIKPGTNLTGSAVVTITVSDGLSVSSQLFNLRVATPVSLDPIADQRVTENAPVAIGLGVHAPDSALTNLVFTGSSSNTALVSGITFTVTPTTAVANIALVQGQTGVAPITITVTDGVTKDTKTFNLNVLAPPVIQPIADQTTSVNTSVSVPVLVSSPSTAVTNLTFSGSSSDTTVISAVMVSLSGTNVTATAVPATGAFGKATVTVDVTDGLVTNAQSFAVTVLAPAVLAPIADQTTVQNTPLVVPLSVTAPGQPLTNLTFIGTAANTTLVPSVTFQVTATNASALVAVGPNQIGNTRVTITVGNGVSTSTQSFGVTVRVPVPPQLLPIPAQSTLVNVPLSVPLAIYTPKTPLNKLTFTGTSSNPNLVSAITFTTVGQQVTAIIAVVPNQTGNAAVSLSVSDGISAPSTQIFVLTVQTPTAVTLAPIADQFTPENTPASVLLNIVSPVVAISNLTFVATSTDTNLVTAAQFTTTSTNATLVLTPGTNKTGVAKITVTVNDGFNTTNQSFNLHVLTPVSIAAIADTRTSEGVSIGVQVIVTAPDTNPTNLVFTGTSGNTALVNTVAFTTNSSGAVALLAVVPGGIGVTPITVSVTDGVTTDTKTFNLNVLAPPTLSGIADQRTSTDTALSIPLGVSSPSTSINNLAFVGVSSDTNVVSGVTVAVTGSSASATVTPAPGANGMATVTISVTDGLVTNSQSFAVTVVAPPVLAPIADQVTLKNTPIVVPLSVTAPGQSLTSLTFTGTAADGTLVSGVAFQVTATTVNAAIGVVPNAAGTTTVTITVGNGLKTSSQTFSLQVKSLTPPVLGPIAAQTTPVNTSLVLPLTVTSPDTALTNLTFLGTSSNPSLVKGITFTNNGATVVATIALVSNQSGTSAITISVSDGINPPSSQAFVLTVTPPIAAKLVATFNSDRSKLTINLTGSPNTAYVLSASSDLKTYAPVTTLTTDANGSATYVVSLAGASDQFYRAVPQ